MKSPCLTTLGLITKCSLLLLAILPNLGCGILKEKKVKPPVIQAQPMSEEEAQEKLSSLGEDWLYGPGFGSTVLNVGAIALFPPYAVYVLGNALIGAAGYEELYASKLLPEEDEQDFNSFYYAAVSGPGRVAAACADTEYRTLESIEHKNQIEEARRLEMAKNQDKPRA